VVNRLPVVHTAQIAGKVLEKKTTIGGEESEWLHGRSWRRGSPFLRAKKEKHFPKAISESWASSGEETADGAANKDRVRLYQKNCQKKGSGRPTAKKKALTLCPAGKAFIMGKKREMNTGQPVELRGEKRVL